MNLMHLKYVVEVGRTRSINKAAENLYMGQPNLSRAIKDFEESLGILIFHRTSKGIEPTAVGAEFLEYAKKILAEVEMVENIYRTERTGKLTFSISLPRAAYLSTSFNNFLKKIDHSKPIEFNYKETNAMRVMKNVEQDGFNLGILRYGTAFENYFTSFISESGLVSQDIFEFNYVIMMSENNPLSKMKDIDLKSLHNCIEIVHGDPFVPNMSSTEAKKAEFSGLSDKNIYIYERGSQYDMISGLKESYMWSSPTPTAILDKFGLVQRRCSEYDKKYKDVLIYKKNYRFTDLDNMFLDEIKNTIKTLNYEF